MTGSPTANVVLKARTPVWADALSAEVHDALAGSSLGVMLYGSVARGTADPGSDVDVLQLVRDTPGTYKSGRVAVTAYTPAAIHSMAQSGSLFVLHLVREGQLIFDPSDTLSEALRAYRQPKSYAPLQREIRNAATALGVPLVEFRHHHRALGRLGLYLLRTSLYVEAALADVNTFDIEAAAKAVQQESLLATLALRRQDRLTYEECCKIRDSALEHFDVLESSKTIAQLAVKYANDSPHASALVVQVLSAEKQIDYVGLPIPPL